VKLEIEEKSKKEGEKCVCCIHFWGAFFADAAKVECTHRKARKTKNGT